MRRLLVVASLLALAACATGGSTAPRYAVFFQEWSAQLDDAGKGAVLAAAKDAKADPGKHITVVGFADPVGSPQANIDISRLRAQVVSDMLVADGVDPARISRSARGATDYTLNSIESRRVEISVAP